MTAQKDGFIFYMDIDLFVFDGPQDIVLPQGMQNGILDRGIGFLDRAALVSIFCCLLSFFTP
jgi:hypothetical protein